MIRKSLYSVHNDLATDQERVVHLELNPAVVMAGPERSFALSAVCIGPRLASTEGRVALRLEGAGEGLSFESLHQRAESAATGECLTVALFPVSREALQHIATSPGMRVSIESLDGTLSCAVGDENRRNVAAFLGRSDASSSTDRPGSPIGESVAV